MGFTDYLVVVGGMAAKSIHHRKGKFEVWRGGGECRRFCFVRMTMKRGFEM